MQGGRTGIIISAALGSKEKLNSCGRSTSLAKLGERSLNISRSKDMITIERDQVGANLLLVELAQANTRGRSLNSGQKDLMKMAAGGQLT